MKNKIIFPFITLTLLFTLTWSCKESFLEQVPTGTVSNVVLATEKGVNSLLIGAYASLDETTVSPWGVQADGPDNWVFGGVCSDDAYKGMNPTNETAINSLENFTATSQNSYCLNKWNVCYDGISRANDVLKVMALSNPPLDAKFTSSIRAQVLFIRAFLHFELKKVFNNIPYITDEVVDPTVVKNNVDTWPMIEADLKYAMENLPATQTDVGRPTKWAAQAFLAKAYLFQKKWNEAKPLLDDIIANSGKSLMPKYWDNFDIEHRHNDEAIFEIQASVNDGAANSANANYSNWGINPKNVDGTKSCCGAYQPSQNLVNAFQVDVNGLPILTGSVPQFKNDMGLSFSDAFVQDTVTPVDPRLDLIVGRRGLPYLDYGVMRGSSWVTNQAYGGPYVGKKGMIQKSESEYRTTTGWASSINAHIYKPIRFAHILLWRAEVAAETGDLATATTLVNMIRTRADQQKLMGRCRTFILLDQEGLNVDYDVPAANYVVKTYSSNFADIDFARKAIRTEMRLEFAMEGQRFFDLVRWGIAEPVMNAYFAHDREFRYALGGATPAIFIASKHEYFPIPQTQIDLQKGALEQNQGY